MNTLAMRRDSYNESKQRHLITRRRLSLIRFMIGKGLKFKASITWIKAYDVVPPLTDRVS